MPQHTPTLVLLWVVGARTLCRYFVMLVMSQGGKGQAGSGQNELAAGASVRQCNVGPGGWQFGRKGKMEEDHDGGGEEGKGASGV